MTWNRRGVRVSGERSSTSRRRPARLGMGVAGAALLVVALLPGQSAAVPAPEDEAAQAAHNATFTIAAWRSGRLEVIEPAGPSGTDHVGVRDVETGQEAVFDRSMADQGIAAAATPSFVDLSWPAISGATGYVITRDEVPWTTVSTTSIRDTGIEAGETYQYRIDVVVPDTAELTDAAQSIGVQVYVPSGTTEMAAAATLIDTALAAAAAKYQYSYGQLPDLHPSGTHPVPRNGVLRLRDELQLRR